MHIQRLVACLFMLMLLPAEIIGLWWAVGSPLVMDSNSICKKTKRLAGIQKTICKREPEIVAEVAKGAKIALLECKYQFRDRRWNCTTAKRSISRILRNKTFELSSFQFGAMDIVTLRFGATKTVNLENLLLFCQNAELNRNDRGFTPVVQRATNTPDRWPFIKYKYIRESAFVYASTAAGVIYAVTQACSMGTLVQCTCDQNARDMSTDGEWEWGGCGDNVEYGYRKSKDFMDARKRKRLGDFTTKIQLHNNEAGRAAVKNFMRKECKCHGLSGSCALKTCWKKMPPFRDVGNRLKEKFDGAIRVIISNDGKNIIPDGLTIKPPSQQDLVYSDLSPDFCKRSKKVGSLGTKGRECDPDSMGVGGCDLLCCNRGHTKMQVKVRENCKCRFMWCCEVICETCESVKVVHQCL